MSSPAYHYLDYNATAPARVQVLEHISELQNLPLNASSIHYYGRIARAIIQQARNTIANIIGVFASEITFTGSATEANNWLIRSFTGDKILVSAIEHASILKTAQQCTACSLIPVTRDGVVDLAQLEAMLATTQSENFLVSIMLANNETGIIQPIREIAAMVHSKKGLLHTDAVQAFGKIAIDFEQLGCDMMTIAAHKMGGIPGAAALIVKNTLTLPPLLSGGGQEGNKRAGTENVPAIAAFAKAAELIDFSAMEALRGWLDAMESDSGAEIAGKNALRLPNTSCIIMPAMAAETQLIHFDLARIAVSSGSACSSGRITPSYVLQAMGLSEDAIAGAIRVSGGWATTAADVATFAQSWKRLRGGSRD